MRVFQFISVYKPYIDYFNERYPESTRTSFSKRLSLLLNHRYYASHILKPAYEEAPNLFFTVANDEILQQSWAKEHGLRTNDPIDILRSQIEHHRADILYSLNPITFDSKFLLTLPGCVRKSVCWNAAPASNADLSKYDLLLSNFPAILDYWKSRGLRVARFYPSHDPIMDAFAQNRDRPIDISFAGQYARWWEQNRNAGLHELSNLRDKYLISFRLLAPKYKSLSDSRILNRIKLPVPYLPRKIRPVSFPAVYGREMYEVYGLSKIVFNAAVDARALSTAGDYRGNMRCFEALGCGACMISDEGDYSDGFTNGTHFIAYKNPKDAVEKAIAVLQSPDEMRRIATAGYKFVSESFSKEKQWLAFVAHVESL